MSDSLLSKERVELQNQCTLAALRTATEAFGQPGGTADAPTLHAWQALWAALCLLLLDLSCWVVPRPGQGPVLWPALSIQQCRNRMSFSFR